MQKDLVSIIIPLKKTNNADLKGCLSSIYNQSYPIIEVIVNEDKNETSNKNKALCIQYNKPSLKVIYLRENQGNTTEARNYGYKFTKGAFIFHLDSDMKLSKNVIKECVKAMDQFDAMIIPEKSVGKGFWAKCRSLERSCYIGDDIIESARFIKRDVYEKVGKHDKRIVFSEDKDLDLRIRNAGYKIGRIKSFIYHDEGEIKIWNHFKKRIFYGKTAESYIRKHFLFSLMEGNVIFRPAFFRNWKKLIIHPILLLGIFFLKIIEFAAVFLGIIYSKF